MVQLAHQLHPLQRTHFCGQHLGAKLQKITLYDYFAYHVFSFFFLFTKDTEREDEKATPMENGHDTIPSFAFLPFSQDFEHTCTLTQYVFT